MAELFPPVKNPNSHRTEVRFESSALRPYVAIKVEESPATIANPQRSGFRFSNFRDERLASRTFFTGNVDKFPKRDEIVPLASEIRAPEKLGVRHTLPCQPDVR